jgi:YidC/Oxa1 family membrane protein insertase
MWSSLITLVTKLLTVLYGLTNNYGVAIILLTILIRLILYPLMQKQAENPAFNEGGTGEI